MREEDVINSEYSKVCTQLGDLQFRYDIMATTISQLKARMAELNNAQNELQRARQNVAVHNAKVAQQAKKTEGQDGQKTPENKSASST